MLFWLLFFPTILFAQFDYGTGADGACTQATFSTGGTYNCTSVNISGAINLTGDGSSALIIKATGAVNITANITLSGNPGSAGVLNGANNDNNGGAGGPGGGAGGNYNGLGGNFSGLAGSGNFAGAGGTDGVPAGSSGAAGGGGGNGTSGGTGDSTSVAGGSGGSSASANSLATSFFGGSGGGAGGRASEILGGSGASGGGGGGALRITAQNGITINADIFMDGGAGGNGLLETARASGSGGGGAGGSLLLESQSAISYTGQFRADGGNGGTIAAHANGGDGGIGRFLIRVPGGESSGLVDIASLSILTTGLNVVIADSNVNEFSDDITSGCGSIDITNSKPPFGGTLFLGFILILFLLKLKSKVLKS